MSQPNTRRLTGHLHTICTLMVTEYRKSGRQTGGLVNREWEGSFELRVRQTRSSLLHVERRVLIGPFRSFARTFSAMLPETSTTLVDKCDCYPITVH